MKPRVTDRQPRVNLRRRTHWSRPLVQPELFFVIDKLRCVSMSFHRQAKKLRKLHGNDKLIANIPRFLVHPMKQARVHDGWISIQYVNSRILKRGIDWGTRKNKARGSFGQMLLKGPQRFVPTHSAPSPLDVTSSKRPPSRSLPAGRGTSSPRRWATSR